MRAGALDISARNCRQTLRRCDTEEGEAVVLRYAAAASAHADLLYDIPEGQSGLAAAPHGSWGTHLPCQSGREGVQQARSRVLCVQAVMARWQEDAVNSGRACPSSTQQSALRLVVPRFGNNAPHFAPTNVPRITILDNRRISLGLVLESGLCPLPLALKCWSQVTW